MKTLLVVAGSAAVYAQTQTRTLGFPRPLPEANRVKKDPWQERDYECWWLLRRTFLQNPNSGWKEKQRNKAAERLRGGRASETAVTQLALIDIGRALWDHAPDRYSSPLTYMCAWLWGGGGAVEARCA